MLLDDEHDPFSKRTLQFRVADLRLDAVKPRLL